MAAAMPLVTGELGQNDCAHGFVDTFMNWMDANGMGYMGWGWYTAGCEDSLITDYSGTPTAFGVGVRAHLLTQTADNRNPETPLLLAQEPVAGAGRGTPLTRIISVLQVNTAVSALAGPTLEPRFREIPRLNLLAQEPFAGADRGTPRPESPCE